MKCRQRKKAWLQQLQAKVEFLSNENEQLKNALVSSRDEISRLSALVGGAGVVGSVPLPNAVGAGIQPVSMNVSIGKTGSTAAAAAASGGSGRGTAGYGY